MIDITKIKVIQSCVILTVYGKLFHSFKKLLKLFWQKKRVGKQKLILLDWYGTWGNIFVDRKDG